MFHVSVYGYDAYGDIRHRLPIEQHATANRRALGQGQFMHGGTAGQFGEILVSEPARRYADIHLIKWLLGRDQKNSVFIRDGEWIDPGQTAPAATSVACADAVGFHHRAHHRFAFGVFDAPMQAILRRGIGEFNRIQGHRNRALGRVNLVGIFRLETLCHREDLEPQLRVRALNTP